MTNTNATAPVFNLSAADLVDVIDTITDSAMEGLQSIQKAINELPAEAHPLLNDLMARFRAIGFAADATVAGSCADLTKVWGVSA